MATSHFFGRTSDRTGRYSIRAPGPACIAASLLELIIVLFIIGVMCAMLLPALQAARSKADTVACQNNVRQVELALSRAIGVKGRFPRPNEWTIDILNWMEERPMADLIKNYGIPADGKLARPPLLRCIAQPEFSSRVPDVAICHYVLVVDRPTRADKRGAVRWELHDRPQSSGDEVEAPWYVGPEISFAEQQKMFATMAGPHPSGVFYDGRGQTRGGQQ